MMNVIPFSKTIVLYWDLPEDYERGNEFKVLLNGSHIGTTDKCHIEINELTPETEYTLSVEMTGASSYELGTIACTTEAEKRRIDISKHPYNAVGDGATLNTAAIQAAIDDCTKDSCVYIPAGDFMTGALFLHSDMELYLEEDAILHGTCDVKDYEPKIKSRFEGHEMMCYASLINIGKIDADRDYNCSGVRISGKGTVCGGGKALAENTIKTETDYIIQERAAKGETVTADEVGRTVPGRRRGRLINVSCAKDVIITGVTVMNGPAWNLHMIYSDNVVTYGCTFRSQDIWNGDGWDPDSSTNCTLFGSEFFTGDDAVAIKSGKNPEGNIINRPCKHIRVFDCISHYGHGITIGSEMSGGVNDVKVWNCDLSNSLYGMEIKGTKKRGGYVKNVSVRYTSVCRVLMHSVGYNDDGEAAPEAPYFADCAFEDMEIRGRLQNMCGEMEECDAIELFGFDGPGHQIKNVRFKNITIGNEGEKGKHRVLLSLCEGVTFENIICK